MSPASSSRAVQWLAACAAVALAGCSGAIEPLEPEDGQERQAVTHGALDLGDPAVVAVVERRTRCGPQDLTLLCSGTLIAPRVVLTAAHCLHVSGSSGTYEVFFGGPQLGAAGGTFGLVVEARAHPRFEPVTHANDLALLRLADPAPVAPQPLPAEARVDALLLGQSVRVVGFGETQDASQPSGSKRQGTMAISEVTPTGVRSAPSPGMSCAGDSGGPVLATTDGQELLYAVTVSGDSECSAYAFNVRVDAALDDFIRPFLDETEQLPAGPGGVLAPAELCTAECQDSRDCPAGLLCVTDATGAARCVLPKLGQGAWGEPCDTDRQCGSFHCARLLSEGPDACRCFTPCVRSVRFTGGGCSTSRSSLAGVVGLTLAALRHRARIRGKKPRDARR